MEAFRQVAGIVLVLALLGVAVWALRRRSGPLRFGPAKSLTAVERLSLTPQHAVHLVHIAGRELLLATHPNGLTLLTENKLPTAEKLSTLTNTPLHVTERV